MRLLKKYLSTKSTIKTVLYLCVGLLSLVLWMIPVLAGYRSPYDPLIITLWLLVVAVMCVDVYRRTCTQERRRQTTYIDRNRRIAYNEIIGEFAYRNGCDLTEAMGRAFSSNHAKPSVNPPDPSCFEATAIIRTEMFTIDRNLTSVNAFDESAVDEWSGAIEVISTGRTYSFDSYGALEDVLCPLTHIDAISIVGKCPDAKTPSCMNNTPIIKAQHRRTTPAA